MINQYIQKLIRNLPEKHLNTKNPQKLDLIFDGGLFNGSYLVGVALFLKKMEKLNYITVERISGTSIGSFISLLYISDKLEVFESIYDTMINHIKADYSFDKYDIVFDKLRETLPLNIHKQMSKRVFINYYNIKKCEKIVKSTYKSLDDVFNTIRKSSFIPFVINGNILYKNKYIDGINPYIFPDVLTSTEKKALFVDLRSMRKTMDCINVKNEKSNFHRILSGVLDVHSFFIKDSNTEMCSYVNNWSSIDYINFHYFKGSFEKMIVYSIYYFVLWREKYKNNKYFKDIFLSEQNILYKIFVKIIRDIYIILLDSYFI